MTIEERFVRVQNRAYIIEISHTSKTAWVAVGDYMGKRVEVVGSAQSMPLDAGSLQRVVKATD